MYGINVQKVTKGFNNSRVGGSAQKVFKNFKVGGTNLGEENITEGFLKNFKVGEDDLIATTPG